MNGGIEWRIVAQPQKKNIVECCGHAWESEIVSDDGDDDDDDRRHVPVVALHTHRNGPPISTFVEAQ